MRPSESSWPGIASTTSLQFFGYSGGGVIATLMAADFPQTTRLVTVAAPLDVDGWTTRHGYARLEGSLNPMLEPPLSPAIAQLHVVGGADDVVPASLVNPYAALQYRAEVRNVAQFTHYCCWETVWKDTILTQR